MWARGLALRLCLVLGNSTTCTPPLAKRCKGINDFRTDQGNTEKNSKKRNYGRKLETF